MSQHATMLCYFLIYLLAVIFLVPPTSTAYLSDDCDYAITVLDWVRSGELQISDFPSMTLVAHLAWGAIFAICFGSEPIVLRASMMCMAWIGGIAIYDWVGRRGASTSTSAFFAAVYIFSPFVLLFSYTFNTDVTGCSMMLVFIAVADRLGLSNKPSHALVLGSLAATCFLVRQTAAVPSIVFACYYGVAWLQRRIDGRCVAVFAIACLLPVIAFFAWLAWDHGVPLGFEKKLLQVGQLANLKLVIVKAARIALAIGLYTLPLSIAFLFHRESTRRSKVQAILATLVVSCVLLLFEQCQPIRPYWTFELFDAGLGKRPEVRGLAEFCLSWRLPQPFSSVRWFDSVVVPASALSAVVWSQILFRRFCDSRLPLTPDPSPRSTGERGGGGFARDGVLAALLVQVSLLMLVWDFFDRYCMPAMALAILLLARWTQIERLGLAAGNFVLAMITCLSLVGIQDSMLQCDTAWQIASELEKQGVSPYNLWVGHQYYGTHAYLPALRDERDRGDGSLRAISNERRRELLRWPWYDAEYFVSTAQDESNSQLLFVRHARSLVRSYTFYVYRRIDW